MLRVDLGVRDSAPVVEGYAYLEDDRVLRILGVEPFADSQFRPYTGGGSLGDTTGENYDSRLRVACPRPRRG